MMKNIRSLSSFVNMRRVRKGEISIHYVMVAIAGIVTVALLLAGVSGWFDTLMGDFAGNAQLPE